jgi:ATP-dependent Lhr-like helicase
MTAPTPRRSIEDWFAGKGWVPFPFQREVWRSILDGKSGLLHSPTGTGKTQAVWLGLLRKKISEPTPEKNAGLRFLWITPMKALANDTLRSLVDPVDFLGLDWEVALRTGDTSSSQRQRQKKRLPDVLITTPESLSLLLSYPESRPSFANLEAVVVDEWHELLGSKRGVQTELGLARLRKWNPELMTWGLSATLGNLEEAVEVLVGTGAPSRRVGVIRGHLPKQTRIETLIPQRVEKLPWTGHLGLNLVSEVAGAIDTAGGSLLFANTRSQSELWYQALLEERPDWAGLLGLHHGSIDRKSRQWVESELAAGRLKCVVCTSSLDLGVDFAPVEQVLQVGSPKGIARLLQRAGRSGHRPGAESRLVCVPSHAFELIEFAAAREAIERGEIESRNPLDRPMDLLVQHLVTLALGGGFEAEEARKEIQSTHAYRYLTDHEWEWALDFVTRGGEALEGYSDYRKVVAREGLHRVEDRRIARFHRLSIGTIASDSSVRVKYVSGKTLGTVEEAFVTRLRPGERFVFSGRTLELVRFKDMTAYVKRSAASAESVPRWMGGRMPLSSQLAEAVRRKLDEALEGKFSGPEMEAVRPILEFQRKVSHLPASGELLVEQVRTRQGHHLFCYPFAGRLAHEGLSVLAAFRLSRIRPLSASAMSNDYGFELLLSEDLDLTQADWRRILSVENLLEDILASLNAAEMAKRQFREIAQVAGLVFPGYPGQGKSQKQIQASGSLIYEVFRRYDPKNLLLEQARREVLENQLEFRRLRECLREVERMDLIRTRPARLSPFAFPLWAERVRSLVSSEKWIDRVRRMAAQIQKSEANPGMRKTIHARDRMAG